MGFMPDKQTINQSLFANAITSKQHKSVAGCQNRQ